MKNFRFINCSINFLTMSLLFVTSQLQSIERHQAYISKEELHEILDNADMHYVYLGKEFSNLYDVISRINRLENNADSVLAELKRHIEEGFSIGLHSAVLDALEYAERTLDEYSSEINPDESEEISDALITVINQVINESLTINAKKLLPVSATQYELPESGMIYRNDPSNNQCCPSPSPVKVVKVRAPLEVFGDAAFKKNVEIDGKLKVYGKSVFKNKVRFDDDVCFKDDVKFKDDVFIKGDLTVDGTVTFNGPIAGLTIIDVVIEVLSATDVVIENLSVTDLVVLSCMDSLCVNDLSVTDLVVASCIDNLCVTNLSVTDLAVASCIDNLCVTNLSVTDLTIISCLDSLCVNSLSAVDETVSGTLSVNDEIVQNITATTLSATDAVIQNLSATDTVIQNLSATDAAITNLSVTDLVVLSCIDSLCVTELSVGEIVILSCLDSLCVNTLSAVDASISGTLSVNDEIVQNITTTTLSATDGVIRNLSVTDLVVLSCIDNLCVTDLSVTDLVVLNCMNSLCVNNFSAVDASISGTLSVNEEIAQTITVTDLTVLSCMDNLCVVDLSATDIFAGSLSLCDLIVDCNIFMNNSTSPTVGNIMKAGNRFIHNFGTDNTFVGINAGNFATTGAENVGVGRNALFSNTTGFNDTSVGAFSMNTNTIGANNAAYGAFALVNNIQGNDNTALGNFTLASNTTGIGNTAVGFQGGFTLATGNNNTFVGNNAALNLTTGFTNVMVGYNSGLSLTTGDDNIYISNPGVSSETGVIRIGTPATHIATFIQGIFGTAVGGTGILTFVDANGQLGTVVSSQRFKHDIQDMNDASNDIMKLRPVTFVYNNDLEEAVQYGLIAEEVNQVFPDLVVKDSEGQPYTVRYHLLPQLLLNELQKLHATVQDQAQVINQLVTDNATINQAMQKVMARLDMLTQ